MRYFGGKYRIRKPLGDFLNSRLRGGQPFVDLFCGACNIVAEIEPTRERVANDKHKYLIALLKAIQEGWKPPGNISEEEYKYVKKNLDENLALSGFVGFACCFGGKWFGGYARSGSRNYASNGRNSLLKQKPKLDTVKFTNLDYKNLEIEKGSLVYCDIPYKNTTKFSSSVVGSFNHEEFYQWVRENKRNYEIYVSEYIQNTPEDFEIVWQMESKQDMRNKEGRKRKTLEVLIKPR